jgi:hypothetical protein
MMQFGAWFQLSAPKVTIAKPSSPKAIAATMTMQVIAIMLPRSDRENHETKPHRLFPYPILQLFLSVASIFPADI